MSKNIISNEEATNRVLELKKSMSVNSLAELIGMSKATMYTRFKKQNWKISERALIQRI